MDAMSHISKQTAAFLETSGVPGVVAGLYQHGRQAVTAQGVANAGTGVAMHADTSFLFGSITKIMTTTLIMREVERGTLDLDTPVVTCLPEFQLRTPGAAGRIRVRHLIDHSSGIDADLFFPDTSGPDALKTCVERLGRECGALFEPGSHVSYSNGGMIVAGRLLEVVTGRAFPALLESDVFAAAGMSGARAAVPAGQAVPRTAAVGHFPDPVTGEAVPTGMFALPPTWGPAGGTALGTVTDLLAFGRIHLGDGTAILSAESVALMRTVSHDSVSPNTSPVGLGWLIRQVGDTRVLTMTGASPGGVAVLIVIPSQDLVYAAYGNDARVLTLHDAVLDQLAGADSPTYSPAPADLERFAGTYRSDQLRIDVRVVDGELEEQVTYEPADSAQEQILTGFIGGPFAVPPMRYVAVGENLFAPAGVPLAGLPPHYLVSYHDGAALRCSGGRMTRRV